MSLVLIFITGVISGFLYPEILGEPGEAVSPFVYWCGFVLVLISFAALILIFVK